MKFPTISATFILLCSSAAMAQAPDDKADAMKSADGKIVTGNEGKHARHADARHCLALKTDVQIIRCAEKYR